MFFNLVFRNAKRARKENLIFFFTLVIAIASFYIILSLEQQSVMQFLKTMESDAVNSLFNLMPILYGFALFLLFVLILFANNYQLDRRSKEFGVYLLLGMTQAKILLLLIIETFFTTILALLIGISAGATLAEVISLVTSRLIGQGLIGYQTSFSMQAILYTIAGFTIVQLLALMIASFRIFRPEIKSLLDGQVSKKQNMGAVKSNLFLFGLGVALLATAYWLAITGFPRTDFPKLILAVILGIVGTISLIRGVAALLNQYVLRARGNHGLRIFTARQLQEAVAGRPISVAISSILLMLAVIFLAQGTSFMMIYNDQASEDASVYHFTVVDDGEAAGRVEAALTEGPVAPYVKQLNPMQISNTSEPGVVSLEPFIAKMIAMLPEDLQAKYLGEIGQMSTSSSQSPEENLVNYLMRDRQYVHLIPLSSYNSLLEAAASQPLKLAENQAAYYVNPSQDASYLNQQISEAQAENEPLLEIEQKPFELIALDGQYHLVTDRSITILTALILPDVVYEMVSHPNSSDIYWNFQLPESLVNQEGLMGPMQEVSELLSSENLYFESYLNSYGRQLFYIVAGSYTFFYLSFLFLLIANSVIGLQFLTQLKQNNQRYQSLLFLGAKHHQIRSSLRSQVLWTFLFPLIPAMFSGGAGIIAMNYYLIENAAFMAEVWDQLSVILLMTVVFILIQWGYAYIIYRASLKEVRNQQFKEKLDL